MVSTTRPTSCFTERSRSGVPICPRKYLETTMFVACWDQNLGISTSRCSKTTEPFSLPMTADRVSHSISSNGSIPSLVKKRLYSRPGAAAVSPHQTVGPTRLGVSVRLVLGPKPTVLIVTHPNGSPPAPGRDPQNFEMIGVRSFSGPGQPVGSTAGAPLRSTNMDPRSEVVKRESTIYCV